MQISLQITINATQRPVCAPEKQFQLSVLENDLTTTVFSVGSEHHSTLKPPMRTHLGQTVNKTAPFHFQQE